MNAATQAESLFTDYPLEAAVLFASVQNHFRALRMMQLRQRYRSADVLLIDDVEPDAVKVLGQSATGLTVKNLSFREAAAHALAALHTTETLPYLAAWLDEQDYVVLRAEAIAGLGSFADGLPIQNSENTASLGFLQLPTSGPYKTPDTVANFARGTDAIAQKEATYLGFWKTWWSEYRSAFGY